MRAWRRIWTTEDGSALLLILAAVVVAGVLFSGLLLALGNGHQQTVALQGHVQASFDAQAAMEIALYDYYEQRAVFISKFLPGVPISVRSVTATNAVADLVQYNEEITATGGLTRTLTATGRVQNGTGVYEERITVNLNDLDAGLPGGGGGGGTTPTTPGGTCGPNEGELPLRALVLGTHLDLSRAAFQNGLSVDVQGGVFLANGGHVVVPHERGGRFIDIAGKVYASGGLVYSHGTGNGNNQPQYGDLGRRAVEDKACADLNLHQTLTTLAGKIKDNLQPLDVYLFSATNGPVTLDSPARQKRSGYAHFMSTTSTLRDVFRLTGDKIILVEGTLLLDEPLGEAEMTSKRPSGYLVIAPVGKAPSELIVPDRFYVRYSGAIAVEQIARYPLYDKRLKKWESAQWPNDYDIAITLTEQQLKLYQQIH